MASAFTASGETGQAKLFFGVTTVFLKFVKLKICSYENRYTYSLHFILSSEKHSVISMELRQIAQTGYLLQSIMRSQTTKILAYF